MSPICFVGRPILWRFYFCFFRFQSKKKSLRVWNVFPLHRGLAQLHANALMELPIAEIRNLHIFLVIFRRILLKCKSILFEGFNYFSRLEKDTFLMVSIFGNFLRLVFDPLPPPFFVVPSDGF